MISIDGYLFWDDKVTNTHRRMPCAAPDKETMTVATLLKPFITLDGNLSDWVASERIDFGDVAGYSLYAQPQGNNFFFALSAPVVIGPNTTVWFNTDLDATTGFQIFAAPIAIGGAEYNLNINGDGTASLYTGAAGETLVLANIQLIYSADRLSIEFAIPTAALGNPGAIDVLYDVNNTNFGPLDYTLQPYVAYADNGVTRTNPSMRIGIVYSETTAANYFSATAYSDLIMAAENQAIQAGIPFKLLNEADLTDLAKLANYDALVFPSFTNVQSGDVAAITNTLLQATKQFGIGLITSGDFMSNDETGAALAGDPYARMKMFFDATRLTGGNSGDVTINNNATQAVFTNTAPGALIQAYSGVGWTAYQSVSGTGQAIATETVTGTTTDGQTVTGAQYAAALATQTTGGRNVLFSSNGVMADSNLLGQAIDYVSKAPGVSVSLDMTRFNGLFATRMDMDQSQFPLDVSPAAGTGIYDILLPILQQWNTDYNFTGSYYVNIGDNPTGDTESTTDWTKSLAYYKQIEALGGEIGTHSYTHVIAPPTTTFMAHTVGITPLGSIQVTLAPGELPSFYGITVGMIVSGLKIGANAQLPPVGGESGAVVNTTVTAVSGNTITLSFVPGGYGADNNGVLGDIPAGTALTFSVPAENTNFLETATDGPASSTGNPFTYEYEFNQAKALLEAQLGHAIYGAAVPGAGETYATAANIFPYFQSGTGYAGYVTGGWTGIGAGYPGAIGFMSPYDQGSVYIAPNMTFDFTEIQYQGKTIAEAEADWLAQFNANAANSAGTPIDVLPIHDYGAAAWNTTFNTPTGSPYATDPDPTVGNMYTYILSHAYNAGYEFVTLEDLAYRYQSFANTAVTSTVNGNVISVSVASAHAGDFALDVAGQGSQVIENVGNWYAYDSDSLFLPETGGNFTVTLGAAADDVTHITALPMRGDLLSVTGNGLNLAFSMFGEGKVVIDLAAQGNRTLVVTGATIASHVGDLLDLTLTGPGQHDVSVLMTGPAPTEIVSTVLFSADTGSSGSDFVTNIAAQTISGTLSAALAVGDVVKVSLDNGTSWLTATAAAGDTTFSLAGVTLTASGTLIARVENSDGVASTAFAHAYTLDQAAPAVPTVPDLVAASDSGVSQADNITSVTNPTFTGTAEAGATVTLFDGTTQVGTGITAANGDWFATTSTMANGTHSITAKATDVAGNVGAASTALSVTVDTVAPAAPSTPDLAAASDSGVSSTDNITNATKPTFTGTAEAGATVNLYDGAIAVGTGVATAGQWSITTTSTLAAGAHSITAKAADAAGNLSAASAALSVTIDTTAPAAPTNLDLATVSDTGTSTADNITSVKTPTFTGKAEAGSTVSLLDGTTVLGTSVATGGAWTFISPTLADGVHGITAKATDVAGNVGTASSALSVTVDTTPPNTPAFTGISANGNNLTLTGTGDASTTVAILNGATQLGTTAVAAGGTWSLKFASSSSVRTVTAVGSDAAGNNSPTTSGSVLIGTSSANTLAGTANNELLYGGGGADTFSFATISGLDVIADFAASGGNHDTINFAGNPVLKTLQIVLDNTLQVGSGVVITQSSGNTLTLNNVTKASLVLADFTFA
jgi:serralysin